MAVKDLVQRVIEQATGKELIAEFKFCPTRRWRADFTIVGYPILIEKDGAVWTGGRHVRPAGFIKDQEKTNTAASMGYFVLRFTTHDIMNTKSLELINNTIKMVEDNK